ncbi:hypothetical protein CBS101457_001843 [Exobasidium rhododendri]|nr:hypothetical protein CBS101457_001843 [Exobasidium rhododendri]
MTDFLPTQEPGPGPTDAPLPTYQSYSAFTTSNYDYTTTVTRIAYDPAGTVAPTLVIQTEAYQTTSVGYSVVNVPLLYTGPFPAPPLGTLYTTAGQVAATASVTQISQSQPASKTVTEGSSVNDQATATAAASRTITSSNPADTGTPSQTQSQRKTIASGSEGSGQATQGGSDAGDEGGESGIGNTQLGGTSQTSGQGGSAQDGNAGTESSNASAGDQGTVGSQSTAAASDQGSGMSNSGGINAGTSQASTTATQSSADPAAGSGATSPSSTVGSGASGQGTTSSNSSSMGATATQSTGTTPAATPAPPVNSSSSTLQSSVAIAASSISNEFSSASGASVSASQASIRASNAAYSASQASVSATNAAESRSASAASASAASASASASSESVSASSLSASASSASTSLTAAYPTATNSGLLPPFDNKNLASKSLSGGQIAGVVVGSVIALALLLLFGLLCARRRQRKRREEEAALMGTPGGATSRGVGKKLSDKWATGFSQSSGRGTYAALGGAGAAGLGLGLAGAAGAGASGSLHSENWEEDRLSGGDGSGFFVVGGKKQGEGGQGGGGGGGGDSTFSPRAAERNGSPSRAAVGGLAGIGAGIAAALAGNRRRSSGKGKGKEAEHQPVVTSSREADMADDDEDQMIGSEGDSDQNNERRGLMSFQDDGDANEMAQIGPSGWNREPASSSDRSRDTILGAGAMNKLSRPEKHPARGLKGGGPFSTTKRDNAASIAAVGSGESAWFAGGRSLAPLNAQNKAVGNLTPAETSIAGKHDSGSSGIGESSSGSVLGTNASSNSTGGRTEVQASPQVSSYTERPIETYGNLALAISPNFTTRTSRMPNFTGRFGDGDLGIGEDDPFRNDDPFADEALLGLGAAGVGLGALAARHRDSNGAALAVGGDGGNGDNSDTSHDERFRHFISSDTPLLGPGAGRDRATDGDVQQPPSTINSNQDPMRNSYTFGRPFAQGGRLSPISSVGEFGERASQTVGSNQVGTLGTATSGGSTYSGRTTSGYGSVNGPAIYASSSGPSATALPFSTPMGTPAVPQEPFHDQKESENQVGDGATATTGLGVAAGFIGGYLSGWSRWHKTEEVPKEKEEEETKPVEGGGDSEKEKTGKAGNDKAHIGRTGREQGQVSQSDLAAEVQSQQASVYYNDSLLSRDAQSSSLKQVNSYLDPSGSGSGSGASSLQPRPSSTHVAPLKGVERQEDSHETSYTPTSEQADSIPRVEVDECDAGNDAEGREIGYTASVSNLSQNISSDASRNGSRRSGQTMSTGRSGQATSGTGTSNSNSLSNSGTSSSRRRMENSSGGSTGAASYNPSNLGRQSISSTRGRRGGATASTTNSSSLSSREAVRGGEWSTQGREDDFASSLSGGGVESEGRSSRATAGGEDQRRFTLDPGLMSVQEGPETVLLSSSYYPSESLGAAVRRRAEREAQEQAGQEPKDTSFEPGYTSETTPLPAFLNSSSTLSAQWRQSPRVQSAAERATATLKEEEERQQQMHDSGSGSRIGLSRQTEPRAAFEPLPPTIAAASSPRRSRLLDPEEARQAGDAGQGQEEGEGGGGGDRGIWPRFLRF